MNTERIFRYHPKDKPIPKGWQRTGLMEFCHHGYWSFLIEDLAHGALNSEGGANEDL